MKLVGGKEASRGFLYQGFASVLEALTDKNKWDKIYIEFPTSNDKVDIALGAANKVIKSIQVKSTINTFSKSDIMVWLHDLIADIDTPEYELCLIGQCEKSAITFINSIEKFYNNTLDNTAVKSLDGFSTDLLRNKRINFIILPFEIEVLEKIVRATLANSIYSAIAQRSTAERRATLHIFAAAPNAFMFFLGQISRGFGKCVLYEYFSCKAE